MDSSRSAENREYCGGLRPLNDAPENVEFATRGYAGPIRSGSAHVSHQLKQHTPSLLPVALHGALRYTAQYRYLHQRETAEVP